MSALRAIAARGMALGGGAGGPTILDLQSGALSFGDKFVDVWSVFNATEGVEAFSRSEVAVYAEVVERIRLLAESTFAVGSSGEAGGATEAATDRAASAARLHLTAPTFFSRISGDKQPKTGECHLSIVEHGLASPMVPAVALLFPFDLISAPFVLAAHDEYWHTHVDLEQYGSFVITSLLYLADAVSATGFKPAPVAFLDPQFFHGRSLLMAAHSNPVSRRAPTSKAATLSSCHVAPHTRATTPPNR